MREIIAAYFVNNTFLPVSFVVAMVIKSRNTCSMHNFFNGASHSSNFVRQTTYVVELLPVNIEVVAD